ncbi:hypothetical protein Taro_001787 [Colocasia esculenta]|uniref:Uncharacterized protein n=1 Tax=Colocasia esculenta TaxID=4460 RepID=A0A843TJ61_COLES|nr:hypothetical protein [Colocasia esculenta]
MPCRFTSQKATHGRNVSSSHRTARTRPLHERSDNLLSTAASTRGRHPKNVGTPRGRERERGKGEARERGKGSGARALSPDPVKATYHPVATGTRRRQWLCRLQEGDIPPCRNSTDNGQISEFEKVKATAILSRSPDTARAVLTQRTPVMSVRLRLGRRDGKAT